MAAQAGVGMMPPQAKEQLEQLEVGTGREEILSESSEEVCPPGHLHFRLLAPSL